MTKTLIILTNYFIFTIPIDIGNYITSTMFLFFVLYIQSRSHHFYLPFLCTRREEYAMKYCTFNADKAR